MSGPPRVGYVEGTVIADGAAYKPRLMGPWMLLYGTTSIDTTLSLHALETNFGGKVYWQTADVLSTFPNSWETPGTERSADGSYPEAFDASGKTAMWARVALWTSLTTGTPPKSADTRLWSTMRGAGWLAARQRLMLRPSSGKVVIPVGNPFPCAGVSGLMFAFVYSGVSGTIEEPTPMWRGFDTGDAMQPGSWSALTTGSDVSANARVVSANSVNTAGKMLAQAGFRYWTSGTDPYATLDIVVAARQ